jgi:capsular exopolysaccharide synthesis family protein
MPRESGSSIVVSSALPLEGKTLISVVMGTVVASEKKRVLVIDGDLRNPRIHQVFHCEADNVGLSDLLTGKTQKLKEAIRQCHIPGLYYMPAGFVPENPVALLKNRRIQDVLEACKKVFDAVIIDAPPILGLVDARVLSAYTDGIILVTRAGHTPIEVLREAKDAVMAGQGKLIGIVLNMADRKKAYGSSYYNSRYYNRYYHRYYHRNVKASRGNGDEIIVDV